MINKHESQPYNEKRHREEEEILRKLQYQLRDSTQMWQYLLGVSVSTPHSPHAFCTAAGLLHAPWLCLFQQSWQDCGKLLFESLDSLVLIIRKKFFLGCCQKNWRSCLSVVMKSTCTVVHTKLCFPPQTVRNDVDCRLCEDLTRHRLQRTFSGNLSIDC